MEDYEVGSIVALLKTNSYPGRGIIIGKTKDSKKAAAAYFIMGRSENSRNRVFSEHEESVVIQPYDLTKVKDPSLIIYSPIKVFENNVIVTNGDQTDTVFDFLKKGKSFEDALQTRRFEPDSPNFTPRISGILTLSNNGFLYKMSILKSMDDKGSACARYLFSYEPQSGLGHFLHTYKNDGDPIPSFAGEPERVSVPDDIDEFTDDIWSSLNEKNKVSLYVRYIDLSSGAVSNRMINKNQ
jgi:IMP cyclohydrolase